MTPESVSLENPSPKRSIISNVTAVYSPSPQTQRQNNKFRKAPKIFIGRFEGKSPSKNMCNVKKRYSYQFIASASDALLDGSSYDAFLEDRPLAITSSDAL